MYKIENNSESKKSNSKIENSNVESEKSFIPSNISDQLGKIPMAESIYYNGASVLSVDNEIQISQMPQIAQLFSIEENKDLELNNIFETAFNKLTTYHKKIKDFQNNALLSVRERTDKYRNDLKDLSLSNNAYKQKCQYLIFRDQMKLAPKGIKSEHIKGIKCTLCQKEDIFGFRCKQCKKYDVCEKCISYIALHHNKEHIFYKSNKPHYQTDLFMNTDTSLNSELTLIGEDSYKYEYKKVPSNQKIEIKVKNNGKIKYKSSVYITIIEGNEPLVVIPQLNPGEEVIKSMSIDLEKLEIGHFQKEIRVRDDNGFFGNPLYIKIEILECIN